MFPISSSKAFLPHSFKLNPNLITSPIPFKFPISSRFHSQSGIYGKVPPARDRIIELGKYKGKMMGSLPSSYLKWVSKNLRAGDTEEWAKFADEVLEDPIYRDRIEWEYAQNILSGNTVSSSSNEIGRNRNAVSELLEISERFGWDNDDKKGWSRIDFELLGTSKGARIPRLGVAKRNNEFKEEKEVKILEEDEGRRRERRERMRQRSRRVVQENSEGDSGGSNVAVPRSPFPGREALLKKVLANRNRPQTF